MIIILSILIAMALLTIGLNVGIKDFKKLRGIVEDEKLIETIKKFPCNTEICKQTLKKLNKEDVKVEEDNSSKTSVYLVFKNKIVMGKANVITKLRLTQMNRLSKTFMTTIFRQLKIWHYMTLHK